MLTFTLMPCLFFNEIQAYTLQYKVYNYNDNSTQPIMQHKPINLTRHTNVKTAKQFCYEYCSKCTHYMSIHLSIPPQDLETR
jgi:hypothetical protein